jgi:hypothetical protein
LFREQQVRREIRLNQDLGYMDGPDDLANQRRRGMAARVGRVHHGGRKFWGSAAASPGPHLSQTLRFNVDQPHVVSLARKQICHPDGFFHVDVAEKDDRNVHQY